MRKNNDFLVSNMLSKIRRSHVLLGIVLILLNFSLILTCCYADSEKRYQEILLNFYIQETVTHGSMLFAASAAAFIFINGFAPARAARKKTNPFWRYIIFVFLSGILLGITIYVGFRVVYYGSLTNDIIRFRGPREDENLSTYSAAFSNHASEMREGLYGNLFKNMLGGLPISLDLHEISNSIFPFCIYSGFLVGYLIFYAFGDHSIDKTRARVHRRNVFWFLYFAVPVFSGFIGVMSIYPDSVIFTVLVPSLDYVGLLIVWCWWTKTMSRDQAIGGLIFLVFTVIAILYIVLLMGAQWMKAQGWVTWNPDTVRFWVIAVPVFIAFVAVTGIGAWIGWTMVTKSPPKPIEKIRKEEEKAEN